MITDLTAPRVSQGTVPTLLLVVPPQRGLLEGTSSGLIAIANYVRDHMPRVEVRLVDFSHYSISDLDDAVSQEVLAARGQLFVGITGTTASYQGQLATASSFKRAEPCCVVICGGHHVACQDEQVLKYHSDIIDLVVRGEGEIAIAELLNHYPRIDLVPNLSYLSKGSVHRTPNAPLLTEADLDLIRPTFDPFKDGVSPPGKFGAATYVSARGCSLSCSFCVVRASPVRTNSISSFIRDLRHLTVDCGYRYLSIEDNFFAHRPRRTREVCAAMANLQREIPFQWDCQTRVESMCTPDIVRAIAGAGCDAVYLGVEALVPTHLRYLGKTVHPERYLSLLETRALPLIIEAGMKAYINLQLGLPGETARDRDETIATLIKLGAVAHKRGRCITVFPQLNVIYPGTPHFSRALDKGCFGVHGADVFEPFTAWETAEEPILQYLGEHFAHGVGGIPLGILDQTSLKNGVFAVCPRRLSAISTQLWRLEDIQGIQVFRYGRHLTRKAASHA